MKKAIWHIAGWIFFYYFWYRYFTVSDIKPMALIMAAITTLFTAATFYLTLYKIAVIRKRSYLILTGILFIIVFSFGRTIALLIVDRLFSIKPASHFNFMGEFFSSAFHISYAFVFGCAVKLSGEQKEKIRTELEFLKNQVNPHFLFNIHNSIYFLINEDPDRAAKAVLMLSEILRYQLHECNGPVVSLEKELHNISNYIELEKLRTGNKIKVEYNFAETPAGFLIAPFILLSLVENAFKHVSDFPDKNNFIRIEAKEKRNGFYFSVVNSTEENKTVQGGIGLKNLRRRLDLIYKDKYELFLAGADNIFTAHLTISAI